MISAREWAMLTGGAHVVPVNVHSVGGFERVGDATTTLGAVSAEQVAELDGRMSVLDHDIQTYDFVPGPDTTPDQFAHAAAAIVSMRLRWQTFRRLEWEAWRDAHETAFSRFASSAELQFTQLEIKYNEFRQELMDLGGVPTAPPAQIVPPPGEPTGVDKVLEFLSSMKWILAIGLGAYVIVGSGAVPAAAALLAAKKTSHESESKP